MTVVTAGVTVDATVIVVRVRTGRGLTSSSVRLR
jgi:hypothetical protein